MCNSIVAAYKQKQTWTFKSKSALAEGDTLSHNANILWTICLLISYTISSLHDSPCFFPISVFAHLSLKRTGLSGKTYANTWETGFAGSLLWPPLGWVSVTCSQWFRPKQCLWLNSRPGEFRDLFLNFFNLLARNLILLQQHHKPCCQC